MNDPSFLSRARIIDLLLLVLFYSLIEYLYCQRIIGGHHIHLCYNYIRENQNFLLYQYPILVGNIQSMIMKGLQLWCRVKPICRQLDPKRMMTSIVRACLALVSPSLNHKLFLFSLLLISSCRCLLAHYKSSPCLSFSSSWWLFSFVPLMIFR